MLSQHAFQVVSQHALQVSRPTPRGEVEGSGRAVGCLQAHTQGEVEGSGLGESPGPYPGGVSKHALRQTPLMATAAGSTHPNGMHSCCY